MRLYSTETLKLFEFDRILYKIEYLCRTKASKQKAKQIKPIEDREHAIKSLNQVNEYKNILENKGYFPDFLFEDFEYESSLLSLPGSVLLEKQILKLLHASNLVNTLIKFFETKTEQLPFLSLTLEKVYFTEDISNAINEIIDAEGIVKSNASKELATIRRELFAKKKEAERKFRGLINELKKLGWIRESEESFYNGRRVVSILSEHKRSLKGVVHGSSETGKTTFIEPQETVELNNQIAELENEERQEVFKLLKILTNNIRPFSFLVKEYFLLLTDLDVVRAKAYFAVELKAVLPFISKEPVINLKNAFHPILFLQNASQKKDTIPLSILLNSERRIVVISGPNAGGKSIALKTIGLFQLMLSSAILVPCNPSSEMSFFNHFLVDIGDSQSIENELSTYSSRLLKMKEFLKIANRRTLFLIDEFGTGTDPELGGAMAEVLLEELNKKNCFGIITTHYSNIKILADKLKGLTNASMLFDTTTLEPKYQMIMGQPGSSYTFEVAEKIGLPLDIISKAKAKISSEKLKLNKLIFELQTQKNEIEKNKKELENSVLQNIESKNKYDFLFNKLEEKSKRSKDRAEETEELKELGKKFKVLSEEWQKTKDKKAVIQKFVSKVTIEKRKRIEREQKEKLENTKEKKIRSVLLKLEQGSKVRILKSHQTGIVKEIKKGKAIVIMGNIVSTISIENLEVVE
jgi:DNA mismatch repair protein MutS2